MIGDILVNS